MEQMTAVGYILDMEEIIEASWSSFQPDGPAAFKLSEKSRLPPALSPEDLPGGWTQILNVRQIRRIECDPIDSDEDSTPASISHTWYWISSNNDLANPNDTEDDCVAANQSDMKRDPGIEDPESPEQQDVIATHNVPGMIRPTQKA